MLVSRCDHGIVAQSRRERLPAALMMQAGMAPRENTGRTFHAEC
jgi:hypothetical protein